MDMALDDIIKTKKIRPGGGRGGRGGRNTRGGRGGQRRGGPGGRQGGQRRGGPGGQRGQRRGSFGGRPLQARPSLKTSGPPKLTISNLHPGVSDSDIVQLFSEFGSMKSAAIHYNSNGKSLGTAVVTFVNRISAMRAMKQYNGVHLDGRAMRIMMEGGVGVTAVAPVKRLGQGGRLQGGQRRGNQKRPQRGRGGRGGSRGGKTNSKPKTAKQLDAEMDAYLKKQPMTAKTLDAEMNEYLKKKPKTAKDLDAEMDEYLNKKDEK